MQVTSSIEHAKRKWEEASENHVASTSAVRKAQEALSHLQGLITHEQAQLSVAKVGQRAGILAAFGLGTDAPAQAANVSEVQARIEALESVLPDHEAAVRQAQAAHAVTDAAVRSAELAILNAKAVLAIEEEAKAFAAFHKAHLHYLAVGLAAKRDDMAVKLGAGYWVTRLYGDRTHIDFCVPGVDAARAALVDLAEQGK